MLLLNTSSIVLQRNANFHGEDFMLSIEQVEWDDVKNEVSQINPILGRVIEGVSAKGELFKARYHYGDTILKEGKLHLPLLSGGTIELSSEMVPHEIRKNLDYRHVPLGFILSKSIEVHFDSDDRVVPSKLISSGNFFGLWEMFDPPPTEFSKSVWSISAGARTAFMLPRIADAISHTRLKSDYGISSYAPKKLIDHSNVFSDLASRQSTHWDCEILFFCESWLDIQENNLSALQLRQYWLEQAWKQSFNCRNQMNYDVAWENFSKEVTRRNWKPRPYIINTIKHLLAIGEGVFPGFSPTGVSEEALPTRFIQDAYMNSYLLKQYAPIIMQPKHLGLETQTVYYSISLPTLLEFAPQAHNPRSIMADMRELRQLMHLLLKSMKTTNLFYEFFHSDEDRFLEILPSNKIVESDTSFMQLPEEFGDLDFADCSPFFRGCIRVTKKI